MRQHGTQESKSTGSNSRQKAESGRFCLVFSAVALLFSVGLPAAAQTPSVAQPDKPAAEASRLESLYHQRGLEALRNAVSNGNGPVQVAYEGKHAWLTGDLKLAKQHLDAAWSIAKTDEDRAAIAPVLALVWADLGLLEEAEGRLRLALQGKPQAHRVRLALGEMLINKGATEEGNIVLGAFTGFYNNDLLKTAAELVVLGKAMHLTKEYKDAVYAFEQALRKEADNVEALTAMAVLFAEKYKSGDAEELFESALKANPRSVPALVGLAVTELNLTRQYSKARDYLSRAEALSPNDQDLNAVQAELALGDADCPTAIKEAGDVLKRFPRNLEARTVIATCAYQKHDTEQFEKTVAEILKINPRYARVFNFVASAGLRSPEERIALNERALKVDPDNADALLAIGLGQSRAGNDREAQSNLNRAFELDSYNNRSFNLVNLYDNEMPNYVFTEHPRFRLRAHKKESDRVNLWVAPLVADAMEAFDRHYQFKPAEDYLAIELFPNVEVFSVRSVGEPNPYYNGFCFGKVVTSRSPTEGNFNWALVIWHELAHVYHLQLSKSHVPRWFTEGLAEYETYLKDPSWRRFHDRELAAALRDGNLRGVRELDKGFTHAKSADEAVQAYHQASLVVRFIAETWGFDVMHKMLRGWADLKKTEEILSLTLSVTPDEFDSKFERWLARYYIHFDSQLTVDLGAIPPAIELSGELKRKPNDAVLWAKLAIAKHRNGDAPGAERAISRALELEPKDPYVNLITMYYYYRIGRTKDGYKHGLNILVAGRDGYDIRVIMGAAAAQLEDKPSSELHYWAATQLWPDGLEAWKELGKIYKREKRSPEYAEALQRMFDLSAYDARTARIYTEFFVKNKDWKKVHAGASRWYDINPSDTRLYAHHATAMVHLRDIDGARKIWELWKAVRPTDEKKIVLSAIEVLSQTGYNSELLEFEQRAKKLHIPDSKIKRAKKPQ